MKYDARNEQPNEDSFYESCRDFNESNSHMPSASGRRGLDAVSADWMGADDAAAQRLR